MATGGADTSASARCRYDDLVQLAHYQRLLEACGHQADEGRWGGIIGVGPTPGLVRPRRTAVGAVGVPRAPDSRAGLSTMETYEAAFGHRLAVSDAALGHRRDPTVPLLAEPILIPACDECGWRIWCYPRLEERADLSLLQGMDLRNAGSTTNGASPISMQLARLDDRTARLVDDGVNLGDLMERAAAMDPADAHHRPHPPTASPDRRPGPRRRPPGRRPAGSRLPDPLLPGIGHGRPGRPDRPGAGPDSAPIPPTGAGVSISVEVPRGDIELDIDMENVAGGTYLWGVLVTERHPGRPPTVDYRPFVSWNPSAVGRGTRRLRPFLGLAHRHTRRRRAPRAGHSRAYCYSKAAENGQMRRIAGRLGRRTRSRPSSAPTSGSTSTRSSAANWSPGPGWD